VGGAGGVEELLADLESDPGEALLDDLELRPEQAVDRWR
jgi:hypothetical protein